MNGPSDIAHKLINRLRWLTFAVFVCLGLSVGVGVFAIVQSINVANDSDRTTAALCTFRSDLENRADQTDRLLALHPKGLAGIPAATLRQSVGGQRRTIAALSVLNCPVKKENP